MELIVAAVLVAVTCAWWIARSRARSRQTAAERPTSDYHPTPPALRTDLPRENTSPSEPVPNTEPNRSRLYAEIADPSGGVRDVSAEEVKAYFDPIRTRLASLRKVASASTRVAQTFGQVGGTTPDIATYSRAHLDAVALTSKTEGLLDIIYFEAEASSNRYQELLERVIDVETELEENLAFIADIEAEIASGDFLPTKPVKAAKQPTPRT